MHEVACKQTAKERAVRGTFNQEIEFMKLSWEEVIKNVKDFYLGRLPIPPSEVIPNAVSNKH